MGYHTALYLFLFLPMVLLFYQLAPKKFRWTVLVLAGYVFFWLISGKLVVYLIGTTIFTYGIGVWIGNLKIQCREKTQDKQNENKESRKEIKQSYKKKEKLVLTVGIVVILSVLAYLKYYNFFATNANAFLVSTGGNAIFSAKKLLLPIGISFYTLQAIGYMVDVYWNKIPAQRHLGKLALFLGFFPQIMEGPISLYGQTADALWEGNALKGESLSKGCLRILWGLFKKMLIADRLYVLVQAIFEHYENYSGVVVAIAAIAYTVQLYMEFSGCMDIIIGSGKLFGVELPENFRQPFAAKNAAEFWRRWHITLGVWFKTYIFYPVSVSSFVKKWNEYTRKHLGKQGLGKYITKLGVTAFSLFPVWLCNGLWHGPRWSYIFYGMYYFVILFMGVAIAPLRNKILSICNIDEHATYWRTLQIIKTWMIIFTGELFFRANGLRAGIKMFRSIFHDFNIQKLWDGTFLSFGLDMADYLVIFVGCIIVFVVGSLKERKQMDTLDIQSLQLPLRWGIYYALIFAVIIFGAYGPGYQLVDMIYAGF